MPRRWRTVLLPNGKRVTVSTYLDAWRKLKAMPPNAQVSGFNWFPMSAGEILAEFSYGVNDRINLRAGLRMNWRENSRRTSRKIAATVKTFCLWCGSELKEYRPKHNRFCDRECRAAFL